MISISNLSYTIGRTPILSDVSLDFPKGQICALIGPNGAGKSTLLSLIARLLPMQVGEIHVNDLKIGQCTDRALARTLAILPQSSTVYPRLTVRELVSFGRYPHHRGHPSEADHTAVAQTLALFEITSLADRQLDTLSGGQRQRAHVAMIYAQDTNYILLDEPLNNLDIAASRVLMALLRDVAHKHGRTIIIVLHDINYACSYADHIITLKCGKLGPIGAPIDIVTPQLMKDIFETNAAVHIQDGQPLIQV